MDRLERRKAAQQLGNRARVPGRLEARSVSGQVVFSGYGSSTGKPYSMGWHDEQIAPGAFRGTLARNPDVSFLIGHDGIPYARTTSTACPLELREDSFGLKFDAHTDATRYPAMQEIAHAIEDGLLYQCSFAFRVDGPDGQEWNDDYTLRTIRAVDLDRGDVSIVTTGANPNTPVTVSARNARNKTRDLELWKAHAFALRMRGEGHRVDARVESLKARSSLDAARRMAEELRAKTR